MNRHDRRKAAAGSRRAAAPSSARDSRHKRYDIVWAGDPPESFTTKQVALVMMIVGIVPYCNRTDEVDADLMPGLHVHVCFGEKQACLQWKPSDEYIDASPEPPHEPMPKAAPGAPKWQLAIVDAPSWDSPRNRKIARILHGVMVDTVLRLEGSAIPNLVLGESGRREDATEAPSASILGDLHVHFLFAGERMICARYVPEGQEHVPRVEPRVLH